jgi:hypothetical protein
VSGLFDLVMRQRSAWLPARSLAGLQTIA